MEMLGWTVTKIGSRKPEVKQKIHIAGNIPTGINQDKYILTL
jgi:hypothetical protein